MSGLLLDVGGVVLLPGPALVARLARRDPRVARVVDPLGGVGSAGDVLWARMLAHEVSERAYWQRRAEEIMAALGLPGGTTRDLVGLLYDGPAEDWLQQDTLHLMTDARAAGLPVGALTNDLADFHGQEWVDRQEWLKLFDVVVDASHTGVLKPDPRAFAAGARSLGLPPEEIVYLDDMPWNVEGGLAAGLLAVQVDHLDPAGAVSQARRLLGLPASDAHIPRR